MNMDNTDLFDAMLKKKADSEKTAAPEQITDLMKNIISRLPENRSAGSVHGSLFNIIIQFFQKIRVKDFLEIAAVALALVLIPYVVSLQNGSGHGQKNILANITAEDVEWITAGHGLPSDRVPSVLFSGKDDKKISGIIDIFRSSSGFRKATKEEMSGFTNKGGGPRTLVLKLKDGHKYYLITAYRREDIKENGQISGFSLIPYVDRFLLTDDSDGHEYYTLYSDEAAKYITNTSNADFPMVKEYTITPENFKVGDKITVTGSSCTDAEVDISLENGDDVHAEKYIIGKARPIFGEWKWEGTLSNNMKTWNGEDIHFKNSKLFLCLTIGERKTTADNELCFSTSFSGKAGLDSGTNVLAGLKVGDVDWITKAGSDHGSYSVLFAEKDSEKVSRIVDILKKSSGLREAQKDELNGLAMKGGGPPTIIIELKNGHKYNLMPAYKIEPIVENGLSGSKYTPCADRFIINDSSDGSHYYTLFSQDAAKYIMQNSDADFH